MDKKKIIVFALILITALLMTAWSFGYYPIAFVKPADSGFFGWRSIFAKSLNTNYTIALNYYKNSLKLSNTTLDSPDFQKEIKGAVLKSLIESKIIESEINRKIGTREFKRQINEKLDRINLNSQEIKGGTKLLYGVSTERLKNTVLVEQARREIAIGLFNSADKNFNIWLAERFAAAKKIILIPIKVE